MRNMKRLYIPNEFVEWMVILIGVTIAGLLGAGIKSWLDNVLEDSGAGGWLPGIAALVLFFVIVAPIYLWVNWSAHRRDDAGTTGVMESESDATPE